MIFAPRREPLAKLPTPLLDLARLGTILGGPRLLIKRDDLVGFALGGNKVRKLEFFLADARTAGADVLITCGGVQSNHCRVTAAAAARASMRCVLVLSGATPARFTGNLLLDQLFGAELVFVETRQERAPRMEALAAEFRAKGLRPYVIPLGGSTPLGAYAYVEAVKEFAQQCRLLGIPVSTKQSGLPAPRKDKIEVLDDYVGEGYGAPPAASEEATRLFARLEGIVLDSTYTAKAAAGMIDLIRRGRFKRDETVCFWHTGGNMALG